ncbi:hypothetical protein M427DRAFT_159057 [Gonapodya prolifera JEL478]|uniref:SH3 domain-containing protein n=1 Tax=Gonapodya prolifera (strain JEL478) TaxID=1344416 RepID=A0A139A1C1_GONPJ|nr:hypothetical protein M427DRAFT_159057 [Gonapodya prolifera JEL478]|eukprot:KXS10552.1 hypothetical protein M427DRAFT_159057 [Gonapodya prolifera JEL478]
MGDESEDSKSLELKDGSQSMSSDDDRYRASGNQRTSDSAKMMGGTQFLAGNSRGAGGMDNDQYEIEDDDESAFSDDGYQKAMTDGYQPILDGRKVLVFERPSKGLKEPFPNLLESLKSRALASGGSLSDPISFLFSPDVTQLLDSDRLPGTGALLGMNPINSLIWKKDWGREQTKHLIFQFNASGQHNGAGEVASLSFEPGMTIEIVSRQFTPPDNISPGKGRKGARTRIPAKHQDARIIRPVAPLRYQLVDSEAASPDPSLSVFELAPLPTSPTFLSSRGMDSPPPIPEPSRNGANAATLTIHAPSCTVVLDMPFYPRWSRSGSRRDDDNMWVFSIRCLRSGVHSGPLGSLGQDGSVLDCGSGSGTTGSGFRVSNPVRITTTRARKRAEDMDDGGANGTVSRPGEGRLSRLLDLGHLSTGALRSMGGTATQQPPNVKGNVGKRGGSFRVPSRTLPSHSRSVSYTVPLEPDQMPNQPLVGSSQLGTALGTSGLSKKVGSITLGSKRDLNAMLSEGMEQSHVSYGAQQQQIFPMDIVQPNYLVPGSENVQYVTVQGTMDHQTGVVPSHVAGGAGQGDAGQPSSTPQNRVAFKTDRVYEAIQPYVPTMEDETLIDVGHQVFLIEVYADGWCRILNYVTGMEGIVPLGLLGESRAPSVSPRVPNLGPLDGAQDRKHIDVGPSPPAPTSVRNRTMASLQSTTLVPQQLLQTIPEPLYQPQPTFIPQNPGQSFGNIQFVNTASLGDSLQQQQLQQQQQQQILLASGSIKQPMGPPPPLVPGSVTIRSIRTPRKTQNQQLHSQSVLLQQQEPTIQSLQLNGGHTVAVVAQPGGLVSVPGQSIRLVGSTTLPTRPGSKVLQPSGTMDLGQGNLVTLVTGSSGQAFEIIDNSIDTGSLKRRKTEQVSADMGVFAAPSSAVVSPDVGPRNASLTFGKVANPISGSVFSPTSPNDPQSGNNMVYTYVQTTQNTHLNVLPTQQLHGGVALQLQPQGHSDPSQPFYNQMLDPSAFSFNPSDPFRGSNQGDAQFLLPAASAQSSNGSTTYLFGGVQTPGGTVYGQYPNTGTPGEFERLFRRV